MELVLALLPSPLLGPAVWEPVAETLRRRGWVVTTALQPAHQPRTTEDVLASYLATVPDGRDVVIVPHSNAGLYVPALTRHRRIVGAVFVDAGLPPAAGDVPRTSPGCSRAARRGNGSKPSSRGCR